MSYDIGTHSVFVVIFDFDIIGRFNDINWIKKYKLVVKLYNII